MIIVCILILAIFIIFFSCRKICNDKENFLILNKYLRYWPGNRFSIGKDFFVEFEGTKNEDDNYNIFIGRLSMHTNSIYNAGSIGGIMATYIDNILYLKKANGEWFSFNPYSDKLGWKKVDPDKYKELNKLSYDTYNNYV
jgi:hypothetical protein